MKIIPNPTAGYLDSDIKKVLYHLWISQAFYVNDVFFVNRLNS